jgi:hypothetical protein
MVNMYDVLVLTKSYELGQFNFLSSPRGITKEPSKKSPPPNFKFLKVLRHADPPCRESWADLQSRPWLWLLYSDDEEAAIFRKGAVCLPLGSQRPEPAATTCARSQLAVIRNVVLPSKRGNVSCTKKNVCESGVMYAVLLTFSTWKWVAHVDCLAFKQTRGV